MTDQSNIQAQDVQKREHAIIPEDGYTETITGEQFMQEMMDTSARHKTAQAEEVHHTMYLNINRKWVPEEDSSFFDRKVFFLKDGRIGMEYGGRVIVRSIELWMSLEQHV